MSIEYQKLTWKKAGKKGIRQCLNYTKVAFHYPDDAEDPNLFIEIFQMDTYDEDDKTNKATVIFLEKTEDLTSLLLWMTPRI